MKIKLTDKFEVSSFGQPYIIAEIGSNHNGDMDLAKKLIKAAQENGADCVKFQSWSKNTLFSQGVYREKPGLEAEVVQYAISEEELVSMAKIARELGLDVASTPFSKKEVDFLVEKLNAPFIKIASMDLNNYPFLKYVAKKGLPIVLATGLSDLAEIDQAVKTIESTGNKNIVVLHCVSLYPPADDQVDLNNIETLQKLYPYPIGFSDHTLGFSIPLAAVAKGACLIEKHFTLDKNLPGWDHQVSMTPEELKIISVESKRINKALGTHRVASAEGEQQKNFFRRSMVANRDIASGERLAEEDIDFKRPGSGLAPGFLESIVGRKIKQAKKKDDLFAWHDFE